MKPPDLATLQHWFQNATTADVPPTEAAAAAGWSLDQVIADDPGLDAAGRMQIYAFGYRARLLQCLEADYPVLRKTLGEELFRLFAADYIRRQPSRSHTLFDLGAGFADYLLATQPAGDEDARLALPVELARVERAVSETQRATGLEEMPAGNVLPFADLQGQDIRSSPCLSLLDVSFDLLPWYQRLKAGDEADSPMARRTHLAVSRVDYRVRLTELSGWQLQFLTALTETASFPGARRRAAEVADPLVVDAQLPIWLPNAQARGIVYLA